MPDLLIKNARVIDGRGAKPFQADLVVTKGIITHMEPGISAE